MAAEIGHWPVEPTILYMFSYYPTNGINEEPSYHSNMLVDYNSALQGAKDYITTQANDGVCIIQAITTTMVFPYVDWQDF